MPACLKTALAVCLDRIFPSTGKRRCVIGLYQISWSPLNDIHAHKRGRQAPSIEKGLCLSMSPRAACTRTTKGVPSSVVQWSRRPPWESPKNLDGTACVGGSNLVDLLSNPAAGWVSRCIGACKSDWSCRFRMWTPPFWVTDGEDPAVGADLGRRRFGFVIR